MIRIQLMDVRAADRLVEALYVASGQRPHSTQALEWLDGPAVRVGAEDVPWPYNRNLEQEVYPQPDDVLTALNKHYGL